MAEKYLSQSIGEIDISDLNIALDTIYFARVILSPFMVDSRNMGNTMISHDNGFLFGFPAVIVSIYC